MAQMNRLRLNSKAIQDTLAKGGVKSCSVSPKTEEEKMDEYWQHVLSLPDAEYAEEMAHLTAEHEKDRLEQEEKERERQREREEDAEHHGR